MRRRRSGRGLLWGAAWFVAFQVLLAIAVEASLFLRDPEDGSRFALFLRCARESESLVVALGTSRTANGIKTDGLAIPGSPQLFNYGITGSDLPEQALRLRRLLATGIRPAAVYLEILPAHLAQPSTRLEERCERLGCLEMAQARKLDLPVGLLCRRWGRARALPCYSARAVLLTCWLPWLLPEEARLERFWEGISEHGWRVFGRDRVSADEYRRGLEHARRRYTTLLKEFHIRRSPDAAVLDMIELCQAENIPVLLYLMPEARVLRDWYTLEGQACLEGYLRGLGRRYGIRVIDAREWLPDDAFADGHHLLPHGATAFTSRFLKEVGLVSRQ
jgi:hypothetical protein